MHTLHLFIQKKHVHSMSVTITDYVYDDSGDVLTEDNQKIFESVCKMRELEIKQAAERLRLMFYKMLINANFDYYIELRLESKLNFIL